jgi:16S rRNA (adenine1518-N6/adenine1519-N6)-dimethyltransferase
LGAEICRFLVKLSEIKQILAEADLQLTKSLGQNFLHDQNQIARIMAAAEVEATDRVLEIGPGLGPLTQRLIERAGHVLAVEKDRRLFEIIRETFAGAGNLELVCGDALEYLKNNRDWEDWKLVSNLPYSVASPMLVELAQADAPPRRMVATLQIEVAQRINAQAGSKHYGILSLLLQLGYESRGWFKIPAPCFFPAPKVDSACITLVRRATPLLERQLDGLFSKIVKRSFSQRRKMIFKLLKQDWPETRLAQAMEEARFSPQARAEEATLNQFVRLTQLLGGSPERGPDSSGV